MVEGLRIEELAADEAKLRTYSSVPISFTVASVFDVDEGSDGIVLTEREVTPYFKDWIFDPFDGGPVAWLRNFDTSGWSASPGITGPSMAPPPCSSCAG